MQDAEPVVASWIRGIDQADLIQRMVAARIPVAPVNDIEALLSDPHVQARPWRRRNRAATAMS